MHDRSSPRAAAAARVVARARGGAEVQRMAHTTAQLRVLWKIYECKAAKMVTTPFGPGKIAVAPPVAAACKALEDVLDHHGYVIRKPDTGAYICKTIKGGTGKSLHSYGIALDVNWDTNPWIDHPGARDVRYSTKATQDDRAKDVQKGKADTDMTPQMIADVKAIKTVDGLQVFRWGGDFSSVKDAMHFEVVLSPDEISKGVDPATVAGWSVGTPPDHALADATPPAAPGPAGGQPPVLVVSPSPAAPGAAETYFVTARSGLFLRSGPGQDYNAISLLPAGTRVFVSGRNGDWARVDLQGDGLADGFVSSHYLRPATATTGSGVERLTSGSLPDITGTVTAGRIKPMFPFTPMSAITANLDFVLSALSDDGIGDRAMVLMALSTIRAETEGFVPIPEGQSKYNTAVTPFDLYDAGTPKGVQLGNTVKGDGFRYRGRGYVQLTGRYNYRTIGQSLSIDLENDPDLGTDPTSAGKILARFISKKEAAIRAALAADDLRLARKLINGGSHGFDRFKDAYDKGVAIL